MYKDKVQDNNERQLNQSLDKYNAPLFIRRYFINLPSKGSAKNYWCAIRDLLEWLIEKKIINRDGIADIRPEDMDIVEAEDITMYLQEREKEGVSPTTLSTRKNQLRSFWNYLARTKSCPVDKNIVENVSYKGIASGSNLVKKFPESKNLEAMAEKISKRPDEFYRVRSMCVLRFLKGTGLRESELAGLDISDVFLDVDVPYIKVLGKGKYRAIEARDVLLTGDAIDALKTWLNFKKNFAEKEKIQLDDSVFINKDGSRMDVKSIQKMFKTYSNGTITPHMIRHWYATVASDTLGLAFVQQQLGHTSLNTTVNNYTNGQYGAKDKLMMM